MAAIVPFRSELLGAIGSVEVRIGKNATVGATLTLAASMKPHQDIVAPAAGAVSSIAVEVDSTVRPDGALFDLGPVDAGAVAGAPTDLRAAVPQGLVAPTPANAAGPGVSDRS